MHKILEKPKKIKIGLLTVFAALFLTAANDFERQPAGEEWLPGKDTLLALQSVELRRRAVPEDTFELGGAAGEINDIEIPGQTPEVFDPELNAIIAALNGKNFTAAEQRLSAYLADKPNNSEAWRYLGDCRYNLGNIDGAMRAYENALLHQPDNYWAKRGQGIAQLYLAYDFYAQNSFKAAHQRFQDALRNLHECLEVSGDDPLASYGQALAAEGVSRELYRVAMRAIGGDNEETAKNIIRNCLDILDVAIAASHDRLAACPADTDARLLLGGLFLRRARMLQPFGHLDEASEDLIAAIDTYQVVIGYGGNSATIARTQTDLCANLLKKIRQ